MPPSAPSTTMKSGTMPVSSIAFAIPKNSHGWPTHSLKPVGLPPESSRSRSTNSSSPRGVENAECAAGDTQSLPIGTPRVSAISGVIFAAGSTPPWPGFAPCESFTSIIFTCGSRACFANFSGSNVPSSRRQPK